MDKMFQVQGKRVKTFNPFGAGCDWGCSYCYAPQQGKRHKRHCKLCGEFKPHFHLERVQRNDFGKNNTYFIESLGDMWGWWVDIHHQQMVMEKCRFADKSNTFYFCTKNPKGYVDYFKVFPEDIKDNFVFGFTLETNREIAPQISKAPFPSARIYNMKHFKDLNPFAKIFVSIEPAMAFDIEAMDFAIQALEPAFVYIGHDNHHHDLPDARTDDVLRLIDRMEKYTEVRRKNIRQVYA